MNVSRRGVLAGGAALLGASALSGCGGSVFAGGDKIRYWNLFGGGDGVRMIEMADTFRKAHPELELEAVTLAWGAPYYTKLAMAAAGGRAPEVAVSHLTRLPQYVPGGLLDPFDLDLLAEYDISRDDFPDVLLNRATVDGRLMAVPLDVHALVMYVNRELADKAGLLAGPDALVELTNPEDFLAAMDELTAVGQPALATGNDPATLWRYVWTFYRQLGGDIVLPEAGTSNATMEYDPDRLREVLEFFVKLHDGKRASPTLDLGGAVTAFVTGKSPLLLNGNWELPTLVTAQDETGEPDFTMVQVPALFGPEKLAFADSHSLVLPHQDSRDPEIDRLTYLFVASLLKDGVTWAGGGHVPAYQPVATSQEYLALEPQSNYRDAAKLAQLDPAAWFSGAGSDFENQFGEAVDAVFRRTLTPDEGMAQIERAINKLLRTPSPV